MRFKIILIVLIYGLLPSYLEAQVQLSADCEVSVLTIGPGQALNDAFGHSAIRIRDAGQNIDLVFDYGRYDFEAEGFYYNFVKGKLDYEIGWAYYKPFIASYKRQKRRVTAQIINLSEAEKQRLFQRLQTAIKPQNKTYSYDFLYNNCATKIKDDLVAIVNDSIQFLPYKNYRTMTFRELIRSHIPQNSWGGFGIDLALGSKIDQLVRVDQQLFLPKYLEDIFGHSKYKTSSEKLVSKTLILSDLQSSTAILFWWSPLCVFSFLSLFIIGFSLRDWKSKSRSKFIDFFIFLSTGILGALIFFLWFGTSHSDTAYNYNFLWAFAFNLLLLPTLFKNKVKKRFTAYLKFLVMLLLLMLLHSFTAVQSFNYTLIPLWVALIVRYFYLIQWSKRHSI